MTRSILDLFPSKKLTPQELHELYPKGVTLTIDRVETRFSDRDQSEYAMVHFVESRKPIGLNETNAQAIADAAGSDIIDAWSGVMVKLLAMYVEIPDAERPGAKKNVLGIRVFPVPAGELPPDLRKGTDFTVLVREVRQQAQRLAAGAPTQIAAKPLGMDSAVKLLIELEKRGKNLDFAVSHLQQLAMGPLVVGKLPPEWPENVKAPVWNLCKGFPATVKVDELARSDELRALWTPPPAAPEVIDRNTGEVVNRPGKPDQISEDDIPF